MMHKKINIVHSIQLNHRLWYTTITRYLMCNMKLKTTKNKKKIRKHKY